MPPTQVENIWLIENDAISIFLFKKYLQHFDLPHQLTVLKTKADIDGHIEVVMHKQADYPSIVFIEPYLSDVTSFELRESIEKITQLQSPRIIITATVKTKEIVDFSSTGNFKLLVKPVTLSHFQHIFPGRDRHS